MIFMTCPRYTVKTTHGPRLQQAFSSVIAKHLRTANIATQRIDALVRAYVHHLENRCSSSGSRGQIQIEARDGRPGRNGQPSVVSEDESTMLKFYYSGAPNPMKVALLFWEKQ